MAARALRSKLSERIFTHVMEDARIMPHRLVKGLPPLAPQMSKIAPLGRDSAFSSANPIKNMMLQSFTSKAKSGPSSMIHGRRNLSSGPPGTKEIPKMDPGTKVSSQLGTEKRSGVASDNSRSTRVQEIAHIVGFGGLIFCSYILVKVWHGASQLHCCLEALKELE